VSLSGSSAWLCDASAAASRKSTLHLSSTEHPEEVELAPACVVEHIHTLPSGIQMPLGLDTE
ncbi:UNVERIFIED_CONTAM: hypothetical protein HDU68_000550, partial [Siphonaria sp. JEL0065]